MVSETAFVPATAPLQLRSSSFTSAQTRPVSRRVATIRRAAIFAAAVPIEVQEDTFEKEVLQSEIPVLVDFYAPWCGPCKLVSPLMDWAANEFEGKLKVAKIDTDQNNCFVSQYNIHGLPTFAVFKAGKPVGIKEGAMGKVILESYLMEYAPEVA